MSGKMMKICVVCGKENIYREFTCSDECHEMFKQKLIKEFGEYKIVVDLTTGKEHRVPTADIIEKGISQEDLKNYPIIEDCSQ
ncbi:hypothetical protein ES705_43225 [subsurface metagenome]